MNGAVKGKSGWVRIGPKEDGNPVNKVYLLDDSSKWPRWTPGRIRDRFKEITTKAILEMVNMFGGIPQLCDSGQD
ncbi:MAG: hypothetical protein J7L91_01305 [Candidatus Korarchaeota archaeon]|nr:hypothetical protein [Candidatus Korarchaeota archaeon]